MPNSHTGAAPCARSRRPARVPLARVLPLAALAALASALPAFPKGIRVRFLAADPADSVVRYDVYRQAAGDSARRIGSAAPAAGADTVAFADTGAERGRAYRYCVRAVDGAGRESDPSDTTMAAIPRLALPDTLRAAAWPIAWILPAAAHPLRGTASLALELVSAAPSGTAPSLSLAYDTATGRIEFRASPPPSGPLRVVLRGTYLGKFSDADTAILAVAAAAPASLGTSPAAADAGGVPAFARARGADGRTLPTLVTPGGGARALYDAAGRRVDGMLRP